MWSPTGQDRGLMSSPGKALGLVARRLQWGVGIRVRAPPLGPWRTTSLSLWWVEPLSLCEFGDLGLHLPPTSVIPALSLPLAVNIFTPVRHRNIKKFSSEA